MGWFEVNLAFLAGRALAVVSPDLHLACSLAMLAALGCCALIGYDGGSSESGGSALFHLFSGATMFAAFFIITDPVSSAVSNKGRLDIRRLIGRLIYLIRTLGNYPDAVAFAVLILNFCAPFIDHYTQPRCMALGATTHEVASVNWIEWHGPRPVCSRDVDRHRMDLSKH